MHRPLLHFSSFLVFSLSNAGFTQPSEPSMHRSCISPVQIAIAQTAESREKGLMGLEKIQENQGLLMVFNKESHVVIWAMGTLIDLDVAFIDSKQQLIAIEYLQATPSLWQTEPINVEALEKHELHSPAPCGYVLEMPAGWFKTRGIHVGDRLEWKGDPVISTLIHFHR